MNTEAHRDEIVRSLTPHMGHGMTLAGIEWLALLMISVERLREEVDDLRAALDAAEESPETGGEYSQDAGMEEGGG